MPGEVTADGKEIFYVRSDGRRVVSVEATGIIEAVANKPIKFEATEEPAVAITGLPMTLISSPSPIQEIVVDVSADIIPTGTWDLGIQFTVVNASGPDAAELFVNGTFVSRMWPQGNSRSANIDSLQTILIPGKVIVSGPNTLEFVMQKGGSGFAIRDNPVPIVDVLASSNNPAVALLFSQASDAFAKLSKEL